VRIGFEVSSFKGRAKTLISVLSGLRAAGEWPLQHHREVEEIVCGTPSSAYNYCRHVVGAFGVSSEAERVFLKNPTIGIRYLDLVHRGQFVVEDTQRRFWRKVVKDPGLALQWARTFRKRLSEEEEMVFVEDVICAKEYSRFVIVGPFPEKVHHALVLKSFGGLNDWETRAVKDYINWTAPMMKSIEGTRS
jgi:hypothetical protein